MMFQKVKMIKKDIVDTDYSARQTASLFVDNMELKNVTNVTFDIGIDDLPTVTITMHADFECVATEKEGE